MTDTLRLYLRYLGISVRAQMQYRASFVMMTIGHFAITSIEFLGIWALFARFRTVQGWTLAEVALFYGMVHIAFAFSEGIARGFDTFPGMVKAGDFDRLLVRPRGTAFQVAAREIQLLRLGRLIQGLAVLLWGAHTLHVAWTPATVLLVVAAVIGGACLFSGLFIIQAALAFWTTESLEIANCVTYGGVEASQVPLTIYRPGFRRLFTFVVPLACINYFPLHAVLKREELYGAPEVVFWASPLVGLLFLQCALGIWEFGVRHYRSTGS
jgi:ABC-2 type transport system permease protein